MVKFGKAYFFGFLFIDFIVYFWLLRSGCWFLSCLQMKCLTRGSVVAVGAMMSGGAHWAAGACLGITSVVLR